MTGEHRGGGGKHERKYGVCGQPTIELRGWHEGVAASEHVAAHVR